MNPRRRFAKVLAGASALLVGWIATFALVRDELSSTLLRVRGHGGADGADGPEASRRLLSINLGGGRCKWETPSLEVPDEIDFHKTVVAGFPSGDKRITYLQMESLSGWPAKDEWDFAYLGMSNHPFIKANYPHHEGIWGWGTEADQVVMVIPFIRRSMVEYHDILWDLGYATKWEDAEVLRDNLYSEQPEVEYYYEWRDERVLDEARWYGWFIDYWMEGGLMRDIFTHRVTTPEHWNHLTGKPFYTRAELSIDNFLAPDAVVPRSYDPHCENGEISGGCEPVAVISADKLLNHSARVGPDETAAIANALLKDDRTGQYVIAQETWDCIWDELIIQKKGPKISVDRPSSNQADDYNFSAEMLEEMLDELDRLIAKYGGPDWSGTATADRIVELLTDDRVKVQAELDEVESGARRLEAKDFLGPRERERRRLAAEGEEKPVQEGKDKPSREGEVGGGIDFGALGQSRFEDKRRRAGERRRAMVEARRLAGIRREYKD